MNYGDYAKEEDIEKIEFERDVENKVVGFRNSEGVDFEAILRNHGNGNRKADAVLNFIPGSSSRANKIKKIQDKDILQ